MPEAELSNEELSALEEFMMLTSLPILQSVDRNAHPLATGVLIEHERRAFLATADHVLEGLEPEDLLMPLKRDGGQISQLGSLSLARPDKAGPDIAIIELKCDDVVKQLRDGWRFLNLNMIGDASRDADHVMAGYPSELAVVDDKAVYGTPFAVFTEMLQECPRGAENPNPDWDLFFALDRVGHRSTGEVLETPKLQGASGGPIWEVSSGGGGLWAPERVLKLVGIQMSAKPGHWFRATKATVVGGFVRKLCET